MSFRSSRLHGIYS